MLLVDFGEPFELGDHLIGLGRRIMPVPNDLDQDVGGGAARTRA